MAGIVYLLSLFWVVGLILQIVVFATEKNRYVKFHAAQAIVLGVVEFLLTVVWFIVNIAFIGASSVDSTGAASLGGAAISLVSGCVLSLIGLALFAFWIWGMISAFMGKETKLPIIGSFAERLAGGTAGVNP